MSEQVFETPLREMLDELRQERGSYSGGQPNNSSSVGLANSLTVLSGQGKCYGFTVLNTKASSQFIQVFDASSLPADGAVPVAVFTVAQTANLGVSWMDVGRWFTRGIQLCNSSTSNTKTIGSADCFFDCQYL